MHDFDEVVSEQLDQKNVTNKVSSVITEQPDEFEASTRQAHDRKQSDKEKVDPQQFAKKCEAIKGM